MSTRKIKDAIDLTTNEPVYLKGHAKATYMSDGSTVEDAINNIEISGGGYVKPEGGIPKTDLASDVQTSLGKADSAYGWGNHASAGYAANNTLTSHTSSSATTSSLGHVTLVSGDVKSVTYTNGKAAAASHTHSQYLTGYTPMTLSTSTTSFGTSFKLYPNQKYASTVALSNNVTFNIDVSSIDTTKDNTWTLSFILGSSARTISFAVTQTGYTIMWANGIAPTFEANTAYEITFKLVGTILFGVCGAFKTI